MTSTSPTGEPAAPEHVGLALRSLASGIGAGTGVTALVLALTRGIQASSPAPAVPSTSGLVANLVLTGWLGGAALAAAVAWTLLRPIRSSYRRGAFAMVAGFATLATALITMPLDALFGRWGLLGLAGAGLAFAALLGRSAWRQGQ
jgi:hypothetical protein